MRNEVVKYNEVFGKNKGKSNKLLNENEWIQSSALVELNVFNMNTYLLFRLIFMYKNRSKNFNLVT